MTQPLDRPDRKVAAVTARSGADRRPAGLCTGAGHIVVHGNAAFTSLFGRTSIGLPARESMIGLPAAAFALLDAVLDRGLPLALWVRFEGSEWRLTAIPRIDPETREPYGVAFHLRRRGDVPVVVAD